MSILWKIIAVGGSLGYFLLAWHIWDFNPLWEQDPLTGAGALFTCFVTALVCLKGLFHEKS
jgi:hypothetical protein